MVYNVTANEVQPITYSHINGSTEELLARFAVSEICKGWPVYRDASEWNNYRSLFTDDAFIWASKLFPTLYSSSSVINLLLTAWSGGVTIKDFIEVSKEGQANGDFIMHRENGSLLELNLDKGCAVGKMKATITRHFTIKGVQSDVDCDVRFIFFCLKVGNDWKCKYYKSFYEKDKVTSVDGKNCPDFDKELLKQYPEGYQDLAVAQHMLGHPVIKNLATAINKEFFMMYYAMYEWLEGQAPNLFWGEKDPEA